jgi:chemotaxis response regulator CheB
MKTQKPSDDFPVVCVGGSAGALEVYTRLLKNFPANMGVAVVMVNHVRTLPTMLHEILPKYTKMPVELITDRLDIRRDLVFIIPERHVSLYALICQ